MLAGVTIALRLLDEVSFGGEPIAGARSGDLLAALATHRSGLSDARLLEEVWADHAPNPKALQVQVSRVRAQCGAGVIERYDGGYRLALADDAVDVWLVESLVEQRSQGARRRPARRPGRRSCRGRPGVRDGRRRTALARSPTYAGGCWPCGPSLLRTQGLALARAADSMPRRWPVSPRRTRPIPTTPRCSRRCCAARPPPRAWPSPWPATRTYRRDLADRLGRRPRPGAPARAPRAARGRRPGPQRRTVRRRRAARARRRPGRAAVAGADRSADHDPRARWAGEDPCRPRAGARGEPAEGALRRAGRHLVVRRRGLRDRLGAGGPPLGDRPAQPHGRAAGRRALADRPGARLGADAARARQLRARARRRRVTGRLPARDHARPAGGDDQPRPARDRRRAGLPAQPARGRRRRRAVPPPGARRTPGRGAARRRRGRDRRAAGRTAPGGRAGGRAGAHHVRRRGAARARRPLRPAARP